MNKELSDALHFLLHCSLKDVEFETQREQFEFIYKYIENLEKENEKLHSYKPLYQSLKRQKEELRDWLKTDSDKIKVFDTKDNKTVELGIVLGLGMCLEKLEELEGVNNE